MSKRLSIGALHQHFAHFPAQLQDILFEFRNLVLEIRPDAAERLDPRGLSYFDARLGGTVKGSIASVHLADDHVQLHLIHGALLPDPKGLLDGGKDAKYKRFARIYALESADWEALGELIRAQNDYVQEHHR